MSGDRLAVICAFEPFEPKSHGKPPEC
jgi:hypothetical protein